MLVKGPPRRSSKRLQHNLRHPSNSSRQQALPSAYDQRSCLAVVVVAVLLGFATPLDAQFARPLGGFLDPAALAASPNRLVVRQDGFIQQFKDPVVTTVTLQGQCPGVCKAY